MKWIIYSMVAVSYILNVLSIIFSGETIDFKFILLGCLTLIYGGILGFLDSLSKSNERR